MTAQTSAQREPSAVRPSHWPSARYVPSPVTPRTRYRRQAPPQAALRRVDPLAWFAIVSLVVSGVVCWWVDTAGWLIGSVAVAVAAVILGLEVAVFGRSGSRPRSGDGPRWSRPHPGARS